MHFRAEAPAAATRRRPVALLDWDNTLHRGFTLHRWCAFLQEAGCFDPHFYGALSEAFVQYRSGAINYGDLEKAAAGSYAAGLAGQPAAAVQDLTRAFVDDDQSRLYDFVRPLLNTLASNGVFVHVISGCPKVVLDEYSRRLGLSQVTGLDVESASGVYVNLLLANPGGEHAKTVATRAHAEDDIVLGAGDSPADRALLITARTRLVVGPADLDLELGDLLRLEPCGADAPAQTRQLLSTLEGRLRDDR